jgi:hypothetical protein
LGHAPPLSAPFGRLVVVVIGGTFARRALAVEQPFAGPDKPCRQVVLGPADERIRVGQQQVAHGATLCELVALNQAQFRPVLFCLEDRGLPLPRQIPEAVRLEQRLVELPRQQPK